MPVRRHFDEELDRVRSTASRMGALSQTAIHRAMQSLLNRDRDAAIAVVEEDSKINELHLQLREEVFNVIATQAPVARDLRLILGLQYIGVELERIGDYAARIAKRARQLADEPAASQRILVDLGQMADLVEHQVHDILDAFIAVDSAAAEKVAAQDDPIDNLYHRLSAELLTELASDTEHVQRAQRLLNVAHTLERIGDRVSNIAEDIVFMDSSRVVELD
jgi:phosphate transport system protein